MAGRDTSVHLDGYREFRSDLRKLEPAVDRALRKDIKSAADEVASDARQHAQRRTGAYARSIRASVTAKGATVGSRLPQAGVLHWGGTIRPRGVPITFPGRPVVSQALERLEDKIVSNVGDAFERAARTAGWR